MKKKDMAAVPTGLYVNSVSIYQSQAGLSMNTHQVLQLNNPKASRHIRIGY